MKDVRASQVIPSELVKPFKSNFPPRLAQSRAELLEKLLVELGTDNSGFTLENVITVKNQNNNNNNNRSLSCVVFWVFCFYVILNYLKCLKFTLNECSEVKKLTSSLDF